MVNWDKNDKIKDKIKEQHTNSSHGKGSPFVSETQPTDSRRSRDLRCISVTIKSMVTLTPNSSKHFQTTLVLP